MQVEAKLVQGYQESKAGDLEGELQEYLHGDGADWASASLPATPRDSAVELVNALVCTLPASMTRHPAVRR